MYDPGTMDPLDRARLALMALASVPQEPGGPAIEVALPLDEAAITEAILALDDAGAIEAVMVADIWGARAWRARRVTVAGREVGRLIAVDHVWSRLKRDLARHGDVFGLLVAGYREPYAVDEQAAGSAPALSASS